MFLSPAFFRQAVLSIALLGCALAIGSGQTATASTCHVADRPVFGLSANPNLQVSAAGLVDLGIELDPGVRIDPSCPTDATHSPATWATDLGELPLLSPVLADPTAPPWKRLRLAEPGARPVRNPCRIDRPPRAD